MDVIVDRVRGHGSLKTKELLLDTLCNFAKANLKFHSAMYDDLLLAYNERSLQSVLFSSVSNTGASVFSKQSVRRKYRGRRQSRGVVDFWVSNCRLKLHPNRSFQNDQGWHHPLKYKGLC